MAAQLASDRQDFDSGLPDSRSQSGRWWAEAETSHRRGRGRLPGGVVLEDGGDLRESGFSR